MAEHLHLVLTNEDNGLRTLTSPQLPGFIYGRDDDQAFMYELGSALEFADAPALPRQLHHQRRFTTADGDEYIVRVADDHRQELREQIAQRLHAALMIGDQRQRIMAGPRLHSGEALMICVLPDDRISWIVEQLPATDAATIATNVADHFVWSTAIRHGDSTRPGEISLAHLGLDENATVSDLIVRLPGAGATNAQPSLTV